MCRVSVHPVLSIHVKRLHMESRFGPSLCLRYVALLGAAVARDSLQPGQEFDRQKHLECNLDSGRPELALATIAVTDRPKVFATLSFSSRPTEMG